MQLGASARLLEVAVPVAWISETARDRDADTPVCTRELSRANEMQTDKLRSREANVCLTLLAMGLSGLLDHRFCPTAVHEGFEFGDDGRVLIGEVGLLPHIGIEVKKLFLEGLGFAFVLAAGVGIQVD